MIKVYYFDGSGACERCKAATGHSFEPPARPHVYCDCPITEDDIVLDDFEIQYRNLKVFEDYVTGVYGYSWGWCFPEDRTVTIEFETDEVGEIPPMLEELARSEGWTPPEPEDNEWEIDVPADHQPLVEASVERYIVEMEADVYIVGTIGDETFEAELEPIFGYYGVDMRFIGAELELRPC